MTNVDPARIQISNCDYPMNAAIFSTCYLLLISYLFFGLRYFGSSLHFCSYRNAQFFPRVSPYPYFSYTIVQVSSGALHLSEPNINSPTAATSSPHRQYLRWPGLVPRLTLWRTWRTPTSTVNPEDLADAHLNSQSGGPGGHHPNRRFTTVKTSLPRKVTTLGAHARKVSKVGSTHQCSFLLAWTVPCLAIQTLRS